MTAAELGQQIIDMCDSSGITACEAADRIITATSAVTAESLTLCQLQDMHPVSNGNGKYH
jgi:hypothetical protein